MNFRRLLVLSLVLLDANLVMAQGAAPGWADVDKTFGRPGTVQNDLYKVTFPRSDLNVKVGNVKVQPGVALTSWIAMRPAGTDVVADGDLVLTSDELNPVMSALQEHGLEITALHNHLIGEEPQVYYMHFYGKGPRQTLAAGLKAALDNSKTPIAVTPPATPVKSWDTAAVEKLLGAKGRLSGAVLGFAFPRSHPISMHQQTMTPAMGMATAMNFQPLDESGVAASGDFVLRENEVNPVLAALRKNGILVTAVHNHMLDDEPRMVFVHFWGTGQAETVARGLREALDKTK
jgi:Domain of Unknown Function (DUF1259)